MSIDGLEWIISILVTVLIAEWITDNEMNHTSITYTYLTLSTFWITLTAFKPQGLQVTDQLPPPDELGLR